MPKIKARYRGLRWISIGFIILTIVAALVSLTPVQSSTDWHWLLIFCVPFLVIGTIILVSPLIGGAIALFFAPIWSLYWSGVAHATSEGGGSGFWVTQGIFLAIAGIFSILYFWNNRLRD